MIFNMGKELNIIHHVLPFKWLKIRFNTFADVKFLIFSGHLKIAIGNILLVFKVLILSYFYKWDLVFSWKLILYSRSQ